MLRIAPPIPAPYLAGVGQLPQELRSALKRDLSPEQETLADDVLRELRERVFQARQEFESQAGVKIEPEPPRT